MAHDVFLSYSSVDKSAGAIVCAALEAAGLRCWMAPRDIHPGEDYPAAILRGIGSCRVMVVIFSASANSSPHILRELDRAVSQKLPIVPFKIDATLPSGNLEYFLMVPQWLDATSLPMEPHLDELVRTVRSIGDKPAAEAPMPAVPVELQPAPTAPKAPSPSLRVVLVYRRSTEPDGRILGLLETALIKAGYTVFIDRHLQIGVEWARQIEMEIRSADAVIVLLSRASTASEMMAYEVRVAQDSAGKSSKPRLLPVRIAFEELLPEELGQSLDRLQYFLWKSPADDTRLVSELLESLVHPPRPAPMDRTKLESAGGAVPLDARFYVVRPADTDAADAIARRDSIILVKGARQMGKTSLLARAVKLAQQAGARVLRTDFQKLTSDELASLDVFYMALAQHMADQLDLDDGPETVWKPGKSPNRNFENFVRRKILADSPQPVLWALDEVDRLFTCPFSGDVFGLFRTWHNDRALDSAGPWSRLTMAIAYATEAHLFISDPNQSPFNVGTRLTLEDFTVEQVADLNRRHNSPLVGAEEVAAFHNLTGGQPYLVRRGLNEIIAQNLSPAQFSERAERDDGPFGDHLRRILVLLARDEQMMTAVRGVLSGQHCPDTASFFRLRSGGLLTGTSRDDCRFRCDVYRRYLKRHLQ